jgi:transposase-like protein
MSRRPRRAFTAEFKAEAVALVKKSGKSVGQIAKELGLTETSLRAWVEKVDKAMAPAPLNESEREELNRLRKDFPRVQMERDFLKKAAAFFARESK